MQKNWNKGENGKESRIIEMRIRKGERNGVKELNDWDLGEKVGERGMGEKDE